MAHKMWNFGTIFGWVFQDLPIWYWQYGLIETIFAIKVQNDEAFISNIKVFALFSTDRPCLYLERVLFYVPRLSIQKIHHFIKWIRIIKSIAFSFIILRIVIRIEWYFSTTTLQAVKSNRAKIVSNFWIFDAFISQSKFTDLKSFMNLLKWLWVLWFIIWSIIGYNNL